MIILGLISRVLAMYGVFDTTWRRFYKLRLFFGCVEIKVVFTP